jgi:hypothetical protein
MEAVEGIGDLKIGQIINTVKYADDLVLLAKEEMVLWDMIEKKKTISSTTYNRPKTTGECGIF